MELYINKKNGFTFLHQTDLFFYCKKKDDESTIPYIFGPLCLSLKDTFSAYSTMQTTWKVCILSAKVYCEQSHDASKQRYTVNRVMMTPSKSIP
ncbi:hypothetical protein PoB_005183400 [Plakobranchus ocellatus]|uniref:Uncharacterized protein n=1 Tax=Plakobranchus ocellatus TaxID=259542 RepID=A0AAV4C2J9_9GAST|nr:hypothetical protein PoB_005183400 [Plakobranchus ocellatus]